MPLTEGMASVGVGVEPTYDGPSGLEAVTNGGKLILQDGQALNVYSEGKIFYKITPESSLSILDASYFRRVLPFSEEGDYLQLDQRKGNYGKIASVSRKRSTMKFGLEDGRRFSVNFQKIDLERVIADGRMEGVNKEMSFPAKGNSF